MASESGVRVMQLPPRGQTEPQLRQYTEAELSQFPEEDKIDEATAASVRRFLAEGAL
jgi:hypothetical protein